MAIAVSWPILTPTRRVGVNSIFVAVIDTNELVAIDSLFIRGGKLYKNTRGGSGALPPENFWNWVFNFVQFLVFLAAVWTPCGHFGPTLQLASYMNNKEIPWQKRGAIAPLAPCLRPWLSIPLITIIGASPMMIEKRSPRPINYIYLCCRTSFRKCPVL